MPLGRRVSTWLPFVGHTLASACATAPDLVVRSVVGDDCRRVSGLLLGVGLGLDVMAPAHIHLLLGCSAECVVLFTRDLHGQRWGRAGVCNQACSRPEHPNGQGGTQTSACAVQVEHQADKLQVHATSRAQC